MKAKLRCQNPKCGKPFGLVRQRAYRCFRSYHYCSKRCKQSHTAHMTAEENRRMAYLRWLRS